MTRPSNIVAKSERTKGGSLPTSSVQAIRGLMLKRGLALIPGDCGYVLATLAADDTSAANLNRFPSEMFGPATLSYASYYALSENSTSSPDANNPWLELSLTTNSVLEGCTPGPIVVICAATDLLPKGLANAPNPAAGRNSVAIRVSDSIVERQLAGATRYPLATRQLLANRQVSASAVTHFEQAVELVTSAIQRLNPIGWMAVEEDVERFLALGPTVVDTSMGTPILVQAGAVNMSAIEACTRQLPPSSFEDWG